MLNFYQIVKDNLSFNRFEYQETVCLEYTCPIEAEHVGIFSRNDYVVYVLSGKKTYRTINGEWTLGPGEILYLKKGAEVIQQYFEDEYCMLGFFLSDDLIKETFSEAKGQLPLSYSNENQDATAIEVQSSEYLEGYFHSMLTYFRGENRPPDHIMVLKLKELLINLMNSDSEITSYFSSLQENDKPSLYQIMEKNACYNLKLQDYAELSHRSLSAFKRDFQSQFKESPGKWLQKRRIQHAANLMKDPALSVSQVAFSSGFEDLSHFSRLFKQVVGSNPSDYKKTVLSA